MKLTVEFNSFQELDDFINGVAIAPALLQIEGADQEVVKEEKPKKEKAKKAEAPKVEAPQEEEPKTEDIMPAPQEEAKTDAPKVAIEDVRALLGKLQKAGKKEEVKELIASFGVDKLSQIKEEDYPALMEKAGELDG